MTTLTPPAVATATPTVRAERLTFARVVRSEILKLVTLRSTWWSVGVTVVLSVSISVLIAFAANEVPEIPLAPVSAIVSPLQFTMLLAGILGAISVTGEYSTGMIRSTLTAVPRRGVVLAAKALVVGGFMAVVAAVTFAIAYLVTLPILTNGIDWTAPDMSIVPLAYGVLALAVCALIGVSFGFLLRSGAGAIAATVGLIFVLPIVLAMFTMFGPAWEWIADLGRFLPLNAAGVLTSPGAEGVGDALIGLLLWPVAGLLGAWVVLRSRDA